MAATERGHGDGVESIVVEVAYGTAERQALIELEVPRGTSVMEAVLLSRIAEQFPEIDIATARLGIFGRPVTPDTVLGDSDRVEIYRPLAIDPKEARRRRAKALGRGVRGLQ
jgi:putative ubiquitin-RnfH superfamily antitoxin RatB of RatAB toxin-antitoxin module